MQSKENTQGWWWKQLASGAVAGIVSRTVTAPLDRIKVFQQVHDCRNNRVNMFGGFRAMLNEGGLSSLWRGNGVNVLKVAPETAIRFMAFEQLKNKLARDPENVKIHERFVAGSLAGVTALTTVYPMEVLKTRMVLRTTAQYSGMMDCAKKILKEEGAKAFYRGCFTSMLSVVPAVGLDLALYESLKNRWLSRHAEDRANPGMLLPLGCGIVSSSTARLATYPLSLVSTVMQAQESQKGSEPVSMIKTVKNIKQNDGFFGLYRGLTASLMKSIPAISITYMVYEKMRQFLGIATKP
ncbi:calcium-binding mitochondrial carrier protein SCaMC-1-like [Salarias fasciatus]|uniref:calcium-binding mitochondrial carrier protein SCaMC-1-like n=1 Tax=Salarias fasciatus TaxID=181472 RepID=UPI001176E179|nr:calcium-binding mitochondrial carrier protein SCaMC-1-like [Salarias fasciatus]